MNWTGEEKVEYGKYSGDTWNSLHRNTLEWYRDNLKEGSYLQVNAVLEITRRNNNDEF